MSARQHSWQATRHSQSQHDSLLTGVSDGDEAGAVEEAVPRVLAPGLVVGVHGHRRPRQEAFVWPGAAASALDGATVTLGAGELQVKKVDSYSCCC